MGHVATAAHGLNCPNDVLEVEGGFLVANTDGHSLVLVPVAGGAPITYGGFGYSDGHFGLPCALALLPGGGLLVREGYNDRFQVFVQGTVPGHAGALPARAASPASPTSPQGTYSPCGGGSVGASGAGTPAADVDGGNEDGGDGGGWGAWGDHQQSSYEDGPVSPPPPSPPPEPPLEEALVRVCVVGARGGTSRTRAVAGVPCPVTPGAGWYPRLFACGLFTAGLPAPPNHPPPPTPRCLASQEPVPAWNLASVQPVASVACPEGTGMAASALLGVVVVSSASAGTLSVFTLGGDFPHVHTFGGPGRAPGQFGQPALVCFSGRSLLVAEWGNDRVQEVDVLAPSHVRFWAEGGDVCGPFGVSASPTAIAVSEDGKARAQHRVLVFSVATGARIACIGGRPGLAAGLLREPRGLRLTSDGAHLVVADAGNHRVCLFGVDGRCRQNCGGCCSVLVRVWGGGRGGEGRGGVGDPAPLRLPGHVFLCDPLGVLW